MGIGPGSWVGLMLGNVPDFVILTLAVSKVEGVVVPLDPTTGNRELEMILEAAPLRALVTRPRGGEGVQAAAGLPYYATPPVARAAGRAAVQVRARDPAAPAGDAAVVQPVQARAAREPRRRGDARRPAVVQFTASVGGDPKGVVKTAANLGAAAQAIGKTLGVTARGSRAVHDAAAHQLRLRLRPAGRAGERHDAVPRGRGVAEAHREAAARAEHRLLRRQPGALRIAGARARRSSRSRPAARAS